MYVLQYYVLLTRATNSGGYPSDQFRGVDEWLGSCAVWRIWEIIVRIDTTLADKFLAARAAIASTKSAFGQGPDTRIGVQMLRLLGLGMPCALPKKPFFVKLGEPHFAQWHIEPTLDGDQGFIATVERLKSGQLAPQGEERQANNVDIIPLLEVCKLQENETDYFFVVDGNRRLTAYLLSFRSDQRILVPAIKLFPSKIASKMEPLGALADIGKLY